MTFDTKNNFRNLYASINSDKPAAEPASGRKEEVSTEQFCSAKPTVHWVSDGWTCMSWEGGDGQPGGYTVTNGQSAMFFDETGNMVFSTGVPGQSGCGGKLILNTGDQLQKAKWNYLHSKQLDLTIPNQQQESLHLNQSQKNHCLQRLC